MPTQPELAELRSALFCALSSLQRNAVTGAYDVEAARAEALLASLTRAVGELEAWQGMGLADPSADLHAAITKALRRRAPVS